MSVVLSGLSTWPHGQDCQTIPESVFFLALILQKLFHRSNRVVVFARIGLALPIVNKCSWKMRIISIIHHLSLLLNDFLPGISPLCPPRSESKLFAFCHGFVKFCSAVAIFSVYLSFAMKIYNSNSSMG
jgi:hypothetical protein